MIQNSVLVPALQAGISIFDGTDWQVLTYTMNDSLVLLSEALLGIGKFP